MKASEHIKLNISVHNKNASKYIKTHTEIFNDIEQDRLHSSLQEAVKAVTTSNKNIKALDVGCGTGNLTRHFISLGIYSVSADISENFLKLVEQNFSNSGLSETVVINGTDLANIENCVFDIVAAYSVLHHVPDYLHLLKEMCRVLRRGGVIYLDHEAAETYYSKSQEYNDFLRLAIKKKMIFDKYLHLLFSPGFYLRFVKKRIHPRYKAEGDIHVWPDDHIEWYEIEQLLLSVGFEIISKRDYLVYKGSYRRDIYELYKHRLSDTTMLIARKK